MRAARRRLGASAQLVGLVLVALLAAALGLAGRAAAVRATLVVPRGGVELKKYQLEVRLRPGGGLPLPPLPALEGLPALTPPERRRVPSRPTRPRA